jgi:hypothetical protein
MFLVSPLAPEAVVWCSGIFDVVATTCVLLATLVARTYSDAASASTRVAFVAVNVAAVASKETAAVGIVLVLIDAWLRGARSRALLVDSGVIALFMLVVGITRVAGATGLSAPPMTRYLPQRDLFGTFGALIDPWHVNILQHRPWAPIAGALAVICLSLGFLLTAEPVRRLSSAGAAVLFVLLPVMPVVRLFFVGADLQGARYLYMAAWVGRC